MIDFNTVLGETAEFDGEDVTISAILWDNVQKKCRLQARAETDGTEIFNFTVDNGKLILEKCVDSGVPLVLSQEVFNTHGKRLGNLENVLFTKNGTLRSLVVGGQTLSKSKISCVGDVILIKEKSLRVAKAKISNETGTVATEDSSTAAACNNNLTVEKKTAPHRYETGRIRRKYGDFGFLVGRQVDKTVLNFQGEVMLKLGETITEETLRQAKISGKLIEIFLHAE